MKKILLASACLLTLTACSMPNQNQQENKPKQNQSQSKAKEEEKVKTKTFSRSVSDDSVIKVKVYYQKDKITAFSFITEKEIPDEEKGKSRKELADIYQKDMESSPNFEAVHKTKGIESEVRISADKKTVHQSVTLDLNKIDIDEAAAAFGVTNQEDTVFERLKDKPEDFFEAIKEQGLTEE
ncbi:DUF1307 domain-containing protein [Streptococcus sanguinis]|uniref:DUF1307 domain-containing protein n=1 Tax=Streptococcus sanguinis TaxID=1305 RepID=A0ABD4VGT1_STRSA|nr:DUF1307 domain-containing protein [Streptococcus sanguinis]MCY7033899.1 DUF1307 domain-containing protein [Streptococcus sanguinis]